MQSHRSGTTSRQEVKTTDVSGNPDASTDNKYLSATCMSLATQVAYVLVVFGGDFDAA